jgi:hypothetical protein
VFKNGVDNQEELSHSFGGVFEQILWVSGFTAGSTHILVGTFGGTTFSLYADTDATAKATGTVSTPSDTDADQVFCIGNLAGLSHSADATLYEVGWWPGVTLTGAQAAILGGGGPATGVPLPTHYWPLISDAVALYGGVDGTVTGASVVAHAGTNWFPLAAARRRSLGLLGVGR